ncbi:hypothetical protein R3P38DRAFT_3201772 [Favolaschia claudopus]|uniref:Uncharacterized protein n=1 Tax=Favolaschia claudopus TaxID=2862362 RepID=A0AAW0AUL7_9AGAR
MSHPHAPTTNGNTLSKSERTRLVRSTRKLQALLGATPQVIEAAVSQASSRRPSPSILSKNSTSTSLQTPGRSVSLSDRRRTTSAQKENTSDDAERPRLTLYLHPPSASSHSQANSKLSSSPSLPIPSPSTPLSPTTNTAPCASPSPRSPSFPRSPIQRSLSRVASLSKLTTSPPPPPISTSSPQRRRNLPKPGENVHVAGELFLGAQSTSTSTSLSTIPASPAASESTSIFAFASVQSPPPSSFRGPAPTPNPAFKLQRAATLGHASSSRGGMMEVGAEKHAKVLLAGVFVPSSACFWQSSSSLYSTTSSSSSTVSSSSSPTSSEYTMTSTSTTPPSTPAPRDGLTRSVSTANMHARGRWPGKRHRRGGSLSLPSLSPLSPLVDVYADDGIPCDARDSANGDSLLPPLPHSERRREGREWSGEWNWEMGRVVRGLRGLK